MSHHESPPRLIDSGELEAPLRDFAQEEMGAQRLERNRRAIHTRLGAVAGLVVAARLSTGAKAMGAVKVCAAVLAVGGAAIAWKVQVARPHPAPPSPPVTAVVKATPVPEAVESDTEDVGETEAAPVNAPPTRATRHHGVHAKHAVAVAETPVAAMPAIGGGAPDGDLAEQLRQFKEARGTLARGDYAGALRSLDRLLAEHAGSPLGPEIAVSRAECLAGAGRTDEAVALLRSLLAKPELSGKRGELSLLLGQQLARGGRCAEATIELTRALALHLTEAQSQAANESLDRCRGH